MNTSYVDEHIVKGDTHGMAQLGGSVISTFACGKVFSPILVPKSVDVLVVMEASEVLRPGFLDLLKPNGTIIMNDYKALPPRVSIHDYPAKEKIDKILENFNVIKISAISIARSLGDETGRTSNVVVLGILSNVKPFNMIPAETWMNALKKNSPNKFIEKANLAAFAGGRNYDK